MLKVIFFLLSSTFLFSQNIFFDPIKEIKSHVPIEIEVFTDLQGQEILSYNLFYKKSNQANYFQEPFTSEDGIYYFAIIPPEFVIGDMIEYYIILETENNTVSIPSSSPNSNPNFIKIVHSDRNIENDFFQLENKVTIISPSPNVKLKKDDIVISVSYFQLINLNLSSIEILIDGEDLTNNANIKDNHLILIPENLGYGLHTIQINMKDLYNNDYQPIIWKFFLVKDDDDIKKFRYSGKLWNDYLNNDIDGMQSDYNISNFNFTGKTEWMDFIIKLKNSSLENMQEQPKNRYSLILRNKFFDLQYGDFYPQFDALTLNGTRVRGLGFDFHTRFFQFNIIQGQLNRAINGNHTNGLSSISSLEYDETLQLDYNSLNVSRDNYTFEDEITAFRLGFGDKKKFNWGLNLVKVKDIINSVEKNVPNAELSFTTENFNQWNSDQFIDKDDDDIFTDGIDQLHIDYNANNTFDDVYLESSDFSNFISYQTDMIILGYIEDEIDGIEYPVKQYIWNITINNDDLNDIIDTHFNNEVDFTYLNNQWEGDKPEDNLVIGSDIRMKFKKVEINSSIAISLLNNNIWDPAISSFDTLIDDYQDCYVGRTYNLDFANEGYYWEECILYDINGMPVDGTFIIDNYISEYGQSVDTYPDIEGIEDIFHINNSLNGIPFGSLFSSEEDITFSEILKQPALAYNLDIKLRYPRQKVQFGIKKVGSSYTALANPYIQSDTRETYIEDIINLFKNKLYLTLNYRMIENGLDNELAASLTDKYNCNINFYPHKSFPSITFNYGYFTKKSGQFVEYEVMDEYGDFESMDTTDTRYSTETNNFNIYLRHSFKMVNVTHDFGLSYYNSETNDLLYDELIAYIDDYISPRSNSYNYNLNFRSHINKHWSTDIYISNSYFDFDKENSPSYQMQDIVTTRLGFNYKRDSVIKRLGAWIDFSYADGTSEYEQYGIKMLLDVNLYKNLNIHLYLRTYFKDILTDGETDNYNNSSVKANLSYKF